MNPLFVFFLVLKLYLALFKFVFWAAKGLFGAFYAFFQALLSKDEPVQAVAEGSRFHVKYGADRNFEPDLGRI